MKALNKTHYIIERVNCLPARPFGRNPWFCWGFLEDRVLDDVFLFSQTSQIKPCHHPAPDIVLGNMILS